MEKNALHVRRSLGFRDGDEAPEVDALIAHALPMFRYLDDVVDYVRRALDL